MKDLSKYVIIAIGFVAISILVPNVQAQNNSVTSTNQSQVLTASNDTSQVLTASNDTSQVLTASNDTRFLMSLNIGDLKDSLVNAKDSVSTGDFENAMTEVTNVENKLLLEPGKQPLFVGTITAIKESIGKSDIPKALDGITNLQIELLKAETDMMKANQGNPQMMMAQNANNDNNNNQQNDNDDNDDDNDKN
jgi:hypothetical protein